MSRAAPALPGRRAEGEPPVNDGRGELASYARSACGGAALVGKLTATCEFTAGSEQFEVTGWLDGGTRQWMEKRIVNASTTLLQSRFQVLSARLRLTTAEQGQTAPRVFVVVPAAGELRIEHLGKDYRVAPGQITLCTSAMPLLIECAGQSRSVVAIVNEALLTRHVRSAPHLLARSVPAKGIGQLLVKHLDATMRIAHKLAPAALAVAVNAANDLVYATVAQSTASYEFHEGNSLRHGIEAYIDTRLGDPSLDAERVAAAHHISVRTLYRLFAESGDTVAAYIRGRRLDRCRADILARPELPIAEVCSRWGVGEPRHFARQYRARFGENPRDTRTAARRGLASASP